VSTGRQPGSESTLRSNAWGSNEWHWGTIDFPDVNGDGKADRCGRGMSGIYCALSTGSSFEEGTVWTSNYSNDKDWGTSESYWGTIQFPDVTGDGRADVCGRGAAGIVCSSMALPAEMEGGQ
jgi:hypothetical protein